MIILKNSTGVNIFRTIAGAMLNIEMSTKHFINGEPIDNTLMIGENYRGYPKIIDGSITYVIRGVFGYIFVAPGTDIDNFERELIEYLVDLERNVQLQTQTEVLKTYHSTRVGYNTNIKVRSDLNLTKGGEKEAQVRYRRNDVKNVKRQFIRALDDTRRGRFTWLITTIDKFDFTINSDNIEDSISRYALSIFYDADDISTLNHNSENYDFSTEYLKGAANIVREKMVLFKHGNPLLFELSSYWKDADMATKSAKSFLRNIIPSKIYENDYALLKFKPVKITESNTGETSTEICSKCHSTLYGDNYALAGSVKEPESDLCVAICPLCLHSSPEEKPMEMKYFRVFRVTFPLRIEDMLRDATVSEERREIRAEALKRVERREMTTNQRTIKYMLIGDKYLAFDNINDYLFTRASTMKEFSGKKVCMASLIE